MDDQNIENKDRQKTKIRITIFVSLFLLALALFQTDTFSNTEIGEELFKDLCDSFFTVGMLLVFSGILAMSAKNGTFNIFTYNGREMLSFFLPRRGVEKERRPYHDYVLEKEMERKKWRLGYLIVIGAVYFAVSAVFLALYLYFPYDAVVK